MRDDLKSGQVPLKCPGCQREIYTSLATLKHDRYFSCPKCRYLMTSDEFRDAIRYLEMTLWRILNPKPEAPPLY